MIATLIKQDVDRAKERIRELRTTSSKVVPVSIYFEANDWADSLQRLVDAVDYDALPDVRSGHSLIS